MYKQLNNSSENHKQLPVANILNMKMSSSAQNIII